VHAQNFVVNESSNWHAVKNVLKFFPKSDTVPVLALVIEAVNAVNLTALVVTSEQEEVFLELDFVGQQQNYSFQRLFAAIDVVAQEKIVCLGWEASILEQAQKIGELSVDVACQSVTFEFTYHKS
jgi:hypothetical protein